MTETMTKGIITRVNGPIVEARDMERAGMLEVVEVGEERLIGEVIRIRAGGVATIAAGYRDFFVQMGDDVAVLGTQYAAAMVINELPDAVALDSGCFDGFDGLWNIGGEKENIMAGEECGQFAAPVAIGVGDTFHVESVGDNKSVEVHLFSQ